MENDAGDSKWWPILYVGKNAAKEEAGSYIWKLRDELAQALDKVDLSDVSLFVDPAPAIWKISHGTESTGISDANKRIFAERHVIVVHQNTAAKGQSKITQGQNFMHSIKKGDFFYLCYGSSIQLLGEIISDDAVPNPEMQNGWQEREYRVIAQSQNTAPYCFICWMLLGLSSSVSSFMAAVSCVRERPSISMACSTSIISSATPRSLIS